MSKSPYEIRLDLLKLANEILATPVFQKRDALTQEYFSKKEIDPSVSYPNLPSFPDTEAIIEEAEKLNRFVSQQ
ncbi:MAG: hypothetical protein ACOYNN_15515 [Terrimicrobiaceae bacterium]